MNRLVRAELLKARSTRTSWIMAGAAILPYAVWTVVSALTLNSASPTNAGLSVEQQVQNVFGNAQEAYPFALILGILAMAGEHCAGGHGQPRDRTGYPPRLGRRGAEHHPAHSSGRRPRR